MREPDEIAIAVRQRFLSSYQHWARGEGTWPMSMSLNPPTTAERAANPVACHAWAQRWADYRGPGTIQRARIRFTTGTHEMPHAITFERPHDVAAVHADTRATWQRCGQRLVALQNAFPGADFSGIIGRLTALSDQDFTRLADTAAWLRANPTSGMLLRQLPIEGINTKWLNRHTQLVLRLIGRTDDEIEPADTSQRRQLHRRLGLAIPPDLIQVAVLDAQLREQLCGMRHFAASVDDLNLWRHRPHTVVILENKETGYAFSADLPETVILHGQGFNVSQYARIVWVRSAQKVIYWGDIDGPGLVFLNDLRGHGIEAASVMMDLETLRRFQDLAVEGALPDKRDLPYLRPDEKALYNQLLDHAARHSSGLLLEQERIPWQHAYCTVENALADPLD